MVAGEEISLGLEQVGVREPISRWLTDHLDTKGNQLYLDTTNLAEVKAELEELVTSLAGIDGAEIAEKQLKRNGLRLILKAAS